jgi:hypothetical protein
MKVPEKHWGHKRFSPSNEEAVGAKDLAWKLLLWKISGYQRPSSSQ